MSPLFDWYITGKVPNDETDFNFQFCHVFFNYSFEKSKYFNYLNPVLERLNPIAVNRIKANCVPKTETIQVSGLHVDINEERVIDSNPKTAIFYINTNNGYTLFEDGTKVESVENRICIFPYYMKHTGTTCTDKNQRVVININYTKQIKPYKKRKMKECMNCWSPYKKRNKDFCSRKCYDVWRMTRKK